MALKNVELMTMEELKIEEPTCADIVRYRAIVARMRELQAAATSYKVTLNSGGGLQITVHLPSGISNVNVQSLAAAQVIFGASDPLGKSIRDDVAKVLALSPEDKAKLVELAKTRKEENTAKQTARFEKKLNAVLKVDPAAVAAAAAAVAK